MVNSGLHVADRRLRHARSRAVASMKPPVKRRRTRFPTTQGTAMPVRQKTFRIEEMIAPAAPRNAPAPDGGSATLQHHEILNELRSLRDLIEQRTAAPAPAKANGASESPASAKTDQMTASDLDTLKYETKSIHRAISRTMQELASLQF